LPDPEYTTGEPFDFVRAATILTDAAARAGAAIMAHYAGGTEIEIKADSSPVTDADRDSQAIILEALKRLAPDTPIVSEEVATDLTASLGPRFFLVDPLDGTKEFIKKRTDFTINVALVENEHPRFGLVYAPARSLLALTISDGKAVEITLDPDASGADFAKLAQTELRARIADPGALTAVVSLSHFDPETESFLSKHKIADRSSAGSAVKFLEIARGRADVYPRFGNTMEWDTAAGHAVLEAAGGYAVTVDGEPLRYGKIGAGLRNPGFVAWGPKTGGSRH
jgi:3'(2'), 5'-bisphosphate nucleotidase